MPPHLVPTVQSAVGTPEPRREPKVGRVGRGGVSRSASEGIKPERSLPESSLSRPTGSSGAERAPRRPSPASLRATVQRRRQPGLVAAPVVLGPPPRWRRPPPQDGRTPSRAYRPAAAATASAAPGKATDGLVSASVTSMDPPGRLPRVHEHRPAIPTVASVTAGLARSELARGWDEPPTRMPRVRRPTTATRPRTTGRMLPLGVRDRRIAPAAEAPSVRSAPWSGSYSLATASSPTRPHEGPPSWDRGRDAAATRRTHSQSPGLDARTALSCAHVAVPASRHSSASV